MRTPRLTDTAYHPGGRLAHRYEYCGSEVLAHDSARTALLVIDLLGDQSLSAAEKIAVMGELVLADPEPSELSADELVEVLDSVLWEIAGIDLEGTRDTGEGGVRAFDWDEDQARIKASLLMAYGLDWEDASRRYTFAEVCDLLAMLCETDSKTPFAEAVYYRTAEPPKRTPTNGEYVDAWRANQRRYRLGGEPTGMERRREAEAAAKAFDSLWRAANGS